MMPKTVSLYVKIISICKDNKYNSSIVYMLAKCAVVQGVSKPCE